MTLGPSCATPKTASDELGRPDEPGEPDADTIAIEAATL